MTVKEISKDEALKLVADFMKDKEKISMKVDEKDVSKMFNGKPVVLLQSDNDDDILGESKKLQFDGGFKCILIEGPADFPVYKISQLLNVFDTDGTAGAVKIGNKVQISVLINRCDI